MRTVVLVPRRGGGYRDEIWEYVRPSVEALGYPVYIADAETEVFAITHAWHNAAEKAGDWDQAILHLADHWVDPEGVHAAVESDHPGVRWCFDRVYRLNKDGNDAFADGKREGWHHTELRRRQLPHPIRGTAAWFEGPRVVTRELWDQIGGYEKRLIGWGGDDILFSVLTEQIHPSIRMAGVLVDLWHDKYSDTEPDDPYYAGWVHNDSPNKMIYREILGKDVPPPAKYTTNRRIASAR